MLTAACVVLACAAQPEGDDGGERLLLPSLSLQETRLHRRINCRLCITKTGILTPHHLIQEAGPCDLRGQLGFFFLSLSNGCIFFCVALHKSPVLPCRCMNCTMLARCQSITKWTHRFCHDCRPTTSTIRCCVASTRRERFSRARRLRWSGSSPL